MCTYTCTFTCVYYVCTCTYMYRLQRYAHIHVQVYIMYLHVRTCIYTEICTCTCTRVYYICTCTEMSNESTIIACICKQIKYVIIIMLTTDYWHFKGQEYAVSGIYSIFTDYIERVII